MKKLQQPFNVFKKHVKNHHNLNILLDVALFEEENEIFTFSHLFIAEKKRLLGQIDVHNKEIVYEISDLNFTRGKGFFACSPIESELEVFTY